MKFLESVVCDMCSIPLSYKPLRSDNEIMEALQKNKWIELPGNYHVCPDCFEREQSWQHDIRRYYEKEEMK